MPKHLGLREHPTAIRSELAGSASMPMLLQACFGALIGVIAAMAIAHAVFPPDGPAASVPSGLLPEVLPSLRVEPREKGFYLLSLLLGPLAGFFATGRLLRSRGLLVALGFVLLATIPLDTAVARRTLQGHLSPWVGLAVVLMLTLAGGLAAILWTARPEVLVDPSPRRGSATASRSLWIYGGCWSL